MNFIPLSISRGQISYTGTLQKHTGLMIIVLSDYTMRLLYTELRPQIWIWPDLLIEYITDKACYADAKYLFI